MEDLILTLVTYAIPVLFAITFHEAAHAYVAKAFGDKTAWMLGRVSANPIRHIDLIGTILVPAGMLLLSSAAGSSMLFGWAKPVPVNFSRLRDPHRDMLWVAAAGPGANLLMAFFWALVMKLAILAPDLPVSNAMLAIGRAGILINVSLMLLNLLPILPLDGGRILVSLMPPGLARTFSHLEPFGLTLLLFLLITGALGPILYPAMGWVLNIIRYMFAL